MTVTWNTVQHGMFYKPFENKDTILLEEVVYDLYYEFCSCADISVNQILKKSEHLVQ